MLKILLTSVLLLSNQDAERKLVWMEGESEESPKPFIVRSLSMNAQIQNPAVDLFEGIYPSISSNSKEISYLAGNSRDKYRLETFQVESQTVEDWFAEDGAYYHPDYSHDGRYLVVSGPFGEELQTAGKIRRQNQIAIIDLVKARAIPVKSVNNRITYSRELLEKAEAIRILKTEGEAFFPELSSDGQLVVAHLSFVTDPNSYHAHGRGKRKQVFVIDVKTGSARAISPENEHCMEPAISSDDLYVAYVCRVDQGEDHQEHIFVYGPLLEGQEQRWRFTQAGERNLTPTFTNEGTIIFTSFRNGQYDLYEQSYLDRTATATQLTNSKMIEYAPSASGKLDYQISEMDQKLKIARSSFALVGVEEFAFVLGGHTGVRHEYNENTVSKTIERWNGKEWEVVEAQLPVAVQGVRAVYHHGVIDIFGGLTHQNGKPTSIDLVQRCELDASYQIQKCFILEGTRLSKPRSSYELIVSNERIYLLGGAETKSMREQIFNPQIEVIQISEKDISVLKPNMEFPQPYRRGFKAITVPAKMLSQWTGDEDLTGELGILVGGMTDDSQFLNEVVIFNPNAKDGRYFVQLPNLPHGLFSTAAAVLDGKLFTFGGAAYFGPEKPANPGVVFKNSRYLNHIYQLDLENKKAGWLLSSQSLSSPKAFLEVYSQDDGLLIIGGTGSNNHPFQDLERFAKP